MFHVTLLAYLFFHYYDGAPHDVLIFQNFKEFQQFLSNLIGLEFSLSIIFIIKQSSSDKKKKKEVKNNKNSAQRISMVLKKCKSFSANKQKRYQISYIYTQTERNAGKKIQQRKTNTTCKTAKVKLS